MYGGGGGGAVSPAYQQYFPATALMSAPHCYDVGQYLSGHVSGHYGYIPAPLLQPLSESESRGVYQHQWSTGSSVTRPAKYHPYHQSAGADRRMTVNMAAGAGHRRQDQYLVSAQPASSDMLLHCTPATAGPVSPAYPGLVPLQSLPPFIFLASPPSSSTTTSSPTITSPRDSDTRDNND